MKLRSNSFVRPARFVAALALVASPLAHAADRAWSANTTGNWSSSASWGGASAPGSTTVLDSPDIAYFQNAAGATVTIDSTTQNIRDLRLGNFAASGAYTIGSSGANSGNSLFLSSGGGLQATGTTSVTHTIDAPLVLIPASAITAGAHTFNNNNPNLLIVNGNVTGGTTSEGIILTLNGNNTSGSTTVNGSISNGGAALGLAVTKSGSSTWLLSGNNTYTGTTTVSAGTLKAGSTTALGSTSTFKVAGTLDLGGFDNTIAGLIQDFGTITNSTGNAKLEIVTTNFPTNVFTGSLTLQIYNNNAINLTSIVNTYSGGTILGKGTGTATTRFNVVSNIGTGTPGALTSGRFGTGAVSLGASITDKSELYFNTSGVTFNNAIVTNSAQGAFEFGAIKATTTGSTIAGAIDANLAKATFSAGTGQTGGINVTGAISGIAGLEVGGNGTFNLTLSNAGTANSYAGNTTIATATSTLTLGAANQIPNGTGKGNLTVTTGTFNMGGFSETTNGLSGTGTVDGTSGTPTLTLGDGDASSTFSGVIRNTAGTLALTKIGTGTQLLSGVNTYTGTTTVNKGILRLGNGTSNSSLADAAAVVIGTDATAILNLNYSGTDTVATLTINGVPKAAGVYSSSDPSGRITGAGTLTVTTSGVSPYTTWAATFLPGNNVSNPAGDNDNDGLVNQQEFAFGLSPISGSSVNPILVQLDKTAGTFTYQRRSATGLTYKILTSTTLAAGSWTLDATATAGQVATPSGSNETVVVTLTGAPLSATKLFVRVAAE